MERAIFSSPEVIQYVREKNVNDMDAAENSFDKPEYAQLVYDSAVLQNRQLGRLVQSDGSFLDKDGKVAIPAPKKRLIMVCGHCANSEADIGRPLKRCTWCTNRWYCDAECQKKEWKYHRIQCDAWQKAGERPSTRAAAKE